MLFQCGNVPNVNSVEKEEGENRKLIYMVNFSVANLRIFYV